MGGEGNEVEKIYLALKNSKFDFRTVRGIAKTTGLPEPTVSDMLERNQNLFRKSQVISKKGEETYALREKKMGASEILDVLRSALTKGV